MYVITLKPFPTLDSSVSNIKYICDPELCHEG